MCKMPPYLDSSLASAPLLCSLVLGIWRSGSSRATCVMSSRAFFFHMCGTFARTLGLCCLLLVQMCLLQRDIGCLIAQPTPITYLGHPQYLQVVKQKLFYFSHLPHDGALNFCFFLGQLETLLFCSALQQRWRCGVHLHCSHSLPIR